MPKALESEAAIGFMERLPQHPQFLTGLLHRPTFEVEPVWRHGFKAPFGGIFLSDEHGVRAIPVGLWDQNQGQTLTFRDNIRPNDAGFGVRRLERDFLDDTIFHRPPPLMTLRTVEGCHVLPERVGIPRRFRQSASPWRVRTPAD